jgi:twitching motility protein PilT
VSHGAADLFLVSGFAPAIRLNGVVTPLPGPPATGEDIEAALLPILHPQALERYRTAGVGRYLARQAGVGRFRINLHRERGRAAATIRALPAAPPLLADLGLPPQVEQITRLHHGLVLVGGATGSGKTTTVAALVNEINRRDARHIVTIEDPIEYEHAHQKSVVEQVEIGIDAPDFPTALRAALRQAPDVIVIGEMRDPETMKIALTAGETGHLVFSTLHTTDVTSTVARGRRFLSRGASADDSSGPRNGVGRRVDAGAAAAGGRRRVPAAELLMIGYGARQHIRKNALQHLHQEITMTKRSGSITLEEALAHLVHSGLITADDARTRTGHAEELEGLLRPSSIVGRASVA